MPSAEVGEEGSTDEPAGRPRLARAGAVGALFIGGVFLIAGAGLVPEIPGAILIPANLAVFLLVIVSGALVVLGWRACKLQSVSRRLEAQLEAVSDQNWELRDAEGHANAFAESIGDLMVCRGRDGQITYANDAFCVLAGRPREALLASSFRFAVAEQGEVAVSADATRTYDQKIRTAQGPRWIAWREMPVRCAGGLEIRSVGRDVTERVHTERALTEARDQAEAANRAKSRFLAMVSHEIRTPLNGILGMADLLLGTPLAPAQKTYVQAVKTSGDRLFALIDEILDFSKIEAGKLDLEPRPFTIAALAEEVVELLAPRAQAKGLEIASYVDERLPDPVIGDPVRLRQVLLNLAGNAVKFTDTGGVALIAEPNVRPDEVTFTVRDTGIGIAAEAQARIFLEFERADEGPTRQTGGTGLGLAISKRIVEHMGGRIDLDSTPGAGSSFHFAVVLPAATESPPAGQVPQLAGTSVLIVAPTAIEAPLIARRLGRWGARTCVVPDEKVASALLPERHWDVVLVDHALGPQATEALAGSLGSVPQRLVVITPNERAALPALLAAGYTGYLVKPVRAQSLAARFGPRTDAVPQNVAAAEVRAGDVGDVPHTTPAHSLAILVAEDNPINALLARSLLTRLGHRPSMVETGPAAVESWRAARAAGTPYDVVLMDVNMPDLDGLEAARRIRTAERESADKPTPIIALTANAFAEDREACLAAGMDDVLAKPLDRERLTAALAARRAAGSLAA